MIPLLNQARLRSTTRPPTEAVSNKTVEQRTADATSGDKQHKSVPSDAEEQHRRLAAVDALARERAARVLTGHGGATKRAVLNPLKRIAATPAWPRAPRARGFVQPHPAPLNLLVAALAEAATERMPRAHHALIAALRDPAVDAVQPDDVEPLARWADAADRFLSDLIATLDALCEQMGVPEAGLGWSTAP